MPILRHSDIAAEPFKGGATYLTLVGDAEGTTADPRRHSEFAARLQNPHSLASLSRDEAFVAARFLPLLSRVIQPARGLVPGLWRSSGLPQR
jgi:hypothetical protein